MFIGNYIKRQCETYGVPWWKLPDFFLVMMAVINVSVVVLVYWWLSLRLEQNEYVIVIVASCSALIVVLGNMVVETSKKVVNTNRLRKEFVDIMSHQMRTPASVIRWYLELILNEKRKPTLSNKQVEYLRHIAEANSKLISLVNDLLNLIQVEGETNPYVIEPVNLLQTVRKVLKSQTLFANSKNVSIQLSAKNYKNPMVTADAIKLKMALENLLNNAIKYSNPHGLIEMKITGKNDQWVCSIQDHGIGIKEEDTEQVFEKFFRSNDNRKLDIQGTGLGLYISKALIEGMDGQIWFKTKEEVGTTFFVSLPKAKNNIKRGIIN